MPPTRSRAGERRRPARRGRFGSVLTGPLLLTALLATSSCSAGDGRSPLVCVAASMGPAVEELLSGRDARFSIASSGTLRTQIEHGARCDVFLSASPLEVARLGEQGLVREARALLANSLVLVASPGTPPGMHEPRGAAPVRDLLAGASRVAVGDPGYVPVGRYALAWLEQLGLAADLEGRLLRANDARAVLAAVESGAVPLGIVYATDAAASRVTVLARAEEPVDGWSGTGPIRSVVALLREDGRGVYRELVGREARRVFEEAGFTWRADEPGRSAPGVRG